MTAIIFPCTVPIAAGVAGVYSAYKTATWHISDDWRRGINGNVHMDTQCNVLCGNMYFLGVIVQYVTL